MMVDSKDDEMLSVPYSDVLIYVILRARDSVFVAIENHLFQGNSLSLKLIKSKLVFLYLNIYKFMKEDFKTFSINKKEIMNASNVDFLIKFFDKLENWLINNNIIQIGRFKESEDIKKIGGF
jgi:hypothetical protein